MLRFGKVYIDKSAIIGKIDERYEIKLEDLFITNAIYNEDGSVEIVFVVSVGEDFEDNIGLTSDTNAHCLRRWKI